MAQKKISVKPRKEIGRTANRRLRQSGKIPGVIYSKGESRSISLDNKEFEKLWRDMLGHTPLVTLNEGKEEIQALIQDTQRHPIKDYFIHVDFFEVTKGEEMTAQASLHVVGESDGVKNDGGTLDVQLHEVEVRARPSKIPDFIEIDVTDLKVGDSLHVSDLPDLDGVTYTTHEDTLLVSVVGAMKEELEPEPVAVEGEGEGEGEEGTDDQAESEETSEEKED